MPYGLLSTGFEPKPLLTLQEEITDSLRQNISPTLNVSETSVLGQFVGIVSDHMAQLWEASQDVYSSEDIDQAEGAALTRLVKALGITRNAATPSTVLMTITLAAGTYAAGSLVVHVAGDATKRFTNDAEITTAGATIAGVPFTAEELGPTRANANTLTVIADPVTGFSAPNNPADAVLGLEIEDDVSLRARHRAELARRGSSTVDAIRVDITDSITATFASVFENDTDVTDGDGRPPHSFEAIVQSGATDGEIAAAIFLAKPAGIRAYGTSSAVVTDTQGNNHTIGFTRPSVITIYIDIAITALSGGEYEGDTAVKNAIADWCSLNLGVGKDVLKARIEALALSVPGVVDAAAEIGLSAGAGTSPANYVITARQIASVDTSRIAVTTSYVTTAP